MSLGHSALRQLPLLNCFNAAPWWSQEYASSLNHYIMAEPSSSVQQSSSGADAHSQVKKSGSSASPSRKSNKIFNNIVNEQSRTQMKHHHVKSFWNNVASEVIQGTAGIECFNEANSSQLCSLFHAISRINRLS